MGATDRVRGRTDREGLAEIGLLLYPGAQTAAINGLTDLFTVANRLSAERGGEASRALRISHWQSDGESGQLERVFDTHQIGHAPLAAVIVPPSLDSEPGGDAFASHVRWITAQHARGAVLCSICSGSFLLAGAGLLNGRTATTHWTHADRLAARFPQVRVDRDKLILDDGDIITAGGVIAWVDLGLRLICRWLGPSVMLATARFFVVDAGREQRFYCRFAPRLHHGDGAILRTQHWLQLNYAGSLTVAALAACAKLGERTFLRRFRQATGLKPIEYVRHLRMDKAREALEFSALGINEIAWAVGYEDQGAFRKVFRRILGLSPGEYRRHFLSADTSSRATAA